MKYWFARIYGFVSRARARGESPAARTSIRLMKMYEADHVRPVRIRANMASLARRGQEASSSRTGRQRFAMGRRPEKRTDHRGLVPVPRRPGHHQGQSRWRCGSWTPFLPSMQGPHPVRPPTSEIGGPHTRHTTRESRVLGASRTFQADFAAMEPVFEQAQADLIPEVKKECSVLPTPGRYQLLQELKASPFHLRYPEGTRGRAWEKVERDRRRAQQKASTTGGPAWKVSCARSQTHRAEDETDRR